MNNTCRACPWSLVNGTLRWLDDHAISAQEHLALRRLWANHCQALSPLFQDCLTQTDILHIFGDATRVGAEPWIGARSVAHIQRIVARAVLSQHDMEVAGG